MTTPLVTVAMLAYKSPKWVDFAVEGLRTAANKTPYTLMVMGNDPSPELLTSGRLTHVYNDPHPDHHYLARVYRAWNHAVKQCRTPWVVLYNSDMYASDYWLDELVRTKTEIPKTIPCSLLVESGRIPSAFPEHVHDFGTDPLKFKIQQLCGNSWDNFADKKRERGAMEAGRLFMPCLLDCDAFLGLGGYPPGNIDGVSGDRIAFDRMVAAGYVHVTCRGSVVYHCQEGEMRDE